MSSVNFSCDNIYNEIKYEVFKIPIRVGEFYNEKPTSNNISNGKTTYIGYKTLDSLGYVDILKK